MNVFFQLISKTWNRTLKTKIGDLTVMKTCSLTSNLSNCKYNNNAQANIQTKRISNIAKHIISV